MKTQPLENLLSVYPWNVASAIYAAGLPYSRLDDDQKQDYLDSVALTYVPGLMKAIDELNDREKDIIHLRFEYGYTLEQCGRKYDITRERIRMLEAHAIRKLRNPTLAREYRLVNREQFDEVSNEVCRLKSENARLTECLKANAVYVSSKPELSQEEIETITNKWDCDISEMNLSVRSYNCLIRGGVRLIGDLNGKTQEDLMKFRNLGRRSMMEVVERAKDFGIEIPRGN